jgi:acetyl-CoA C-acetyltransferase
VNNNIYILGGFQSDFARSWTAESKSIFDMFAYTLENALEVTGIDPEEIQRGHVGNASGEALSGYAQMGGFFGMANDLFAGMPASRHEAACCSGTMAILGAMSDIASGFYDLTCVVGAEVMSGDFGPAIDKAISAHAWPPTEVAEGEWTWPKLFSQFLEDYRERYGVKYEHLGEISKINLANAKDNPNARGRNFATSCSCFTENDETNPIAINLFRMHDICRIADGAAAIFLAGEEYASRYAARRGIALADIPRIKGFGHSTMPTALEPKRRLSRASDSPYYMPHLNKTIQQALSRAGFKSIQQINGMEVHDCFNVSEYMVIDHCGLVAPGEAWKLVEDGTILRNGSFPINPSGGLIGVGHPIGCTGVRMALDCYKQVTGQAGGYQVPGAKNMMTMNIGGTLTTVGSLVIGVGD